MKLQPVVDLYSIWPWVRDGLVKCAEKTRERFRPEDVFLMLNAKTAHLYVFENGKPLGFIIVQRMIDPDGPVLFVFAVWGELEAHQDECLAELEALAKGIGAKRIRMQSPRDGWGKLPFFKGVTIVYEHEMQP